MRKLHIPYENNVDFQIQCAKSHIALPYPYYCNYSKQMKYN